MSLPEARSSAGADERVRRLARFLAGRGAPIAVALLAFATFAGTLGHGFVYDDGPQILDNPWIWSVSGLPHLMTRPVWAFLSENVGNYYRPTMSLLHFGAAQIFGRHPAGFHLIAVAMHALASVIALLFLRRITTPGTAALAAALFAVHPIHAESVAWLSASPDVNLTVFLLLALLLWTRACISPTPVRAAIPAGVACLVALFSKETAIVAPVLALLLPPSVGGPAPGAAGPDRPARRDLLAAAWGAAFLVPLGLYLAARAGALGGLVPEVARADLAGLPGMATALLLVPRYVALAFLPLHPAPDYVIAPAATLLAKGPILGAAVLVAAAALYLILRRKAPPAAFGVVLLLVPLAPCLRVAYFSGSLQADRYLYLPALGACLLIAEAASALGRRGRSIEVLLAVTAACAILAGAARAATAAAMWRDSETLGRAGIALEPRTVLMRLELIHALDASGRTAEALDEAREAERLAPDERRVLAAVAGLQARLAETGGGDPIAIYRAALLADPVRAHLWVGLSAAYLKAGMPRDAIEAAERALALERFNRAALLNLGTARGATGDAAGQEREARRLLEVDPESAEGFLNLGAARLTQDDPEGAAAALDRAVALDPNLARAHLYLSVIAARQGEREGALREAERAAELDPADAEVLNHLGAARAAAGDLDGARAAWEKALAARPDDPQARANLERLNAGGTAPTPATAPAAAPTPAPATAPAPRTTPGPAPR